MILSSQQKNGFIARGLFEFSFISLTEVIISSLDTKKIFIVALFPPIDIKSGHELFSFFTKRYGIDSDNSYNRNC